ncbi:hypothetical protein [Acidovorax sp. CCYZU-2555]|uniref:hypothetical protein n=1 Tax=Acidovorax sp. CCYZU-2555 TaxID=2835042 RepID=UPI001BCC3736|nr:hypothetical protein [Acidovorax sp. CCYZU-2555]MBS7776767.1 hypothetical protein [Acidovorax sp. CCYZU-2555]
MTHALALACAAAACLLALVRWAQATSTRSWGDASAGSQPQRKAWCLALGTLALQTTAASAIAGPAAGIAIALASWMVLGWSLVLAMNQWPQGSLLWARRIGIAGWAGCVLALTVHALA